MPVIHRSFQSPVGNSVESLSIGEHSLQVIENCRSDLILRLAALFHDTGKLGNHSALTSGEIAEASLTDLKYDKKSTHRVVRLIGKGDLKLEGEREQLAYQLRKLLGSLGHEDTFRLLELLKADIQSSGSLCREERGKRVEEAFHIVRDIIERKEPLCISDLAINGWDLLEIGIGKKNKQDIGKALNEALEWVLHNPEENKKEHLLSKLKTLFG